MFSDADSDSLTITATSSDETVAKVRVPSAGSALTLTGVAEGTATVTVNSRDTDGNRVLDDFDVVMGGRHAALIARMKQWRNDPCCVGDKAHTDRWDRALLAFGETVGPRVPHAGDGLCGPRSGRCRGVSKLIIPRVLRKYIAGHIKRAL